MQNGKPTTKEQLDGSEEPKGVIVTVRLMNSQTDVEEKQLKVLQRTRVSHLLKTISWSFNKSGFYSQDFDAFLIRPDMEVYLELNSRIRKYGIKNEDIIEVRRKKLLIPLQVNVHEGDVREYQVNSSLPVYETVKTLGSMIGVENTKELSLALPVASEKSIASVTSINWLDPTKSLNAQGVTSGDTVLIRKKFFIFNDDMDEAERNPLLRDLLYHQFQTQLLHQRKTSRNMSQACSYGIPSETSDADSLSDQEESLETATFSSEVMQTLEQSKKEPQTQTSRVEWIQTLSRQKSLASFFPIKFAVDSEAQYLCVQSNGVCITAHHQADTDYVHEWSFEEITSWEKFENGIKISVKGEAYTMFSDQIDQIAEHLKQVSFFKGEEASGCKQDNTPSETKLSLSPAVSVPSSLDDYSSESSPEEKEEAGPGFNESTSSGAEASVNYFGSLSPPNSPPRKKLERTTNITPPAYFGLSYKELLDSHMLIHIIVLDQEIRQILVNVMQPVRSVIRDICATYCIQYPEEHFLRYPKSTADILSKYGGKPRLDSLSGEFVSSGNPQGYKDVELDGDKTLVEQLHFDIQPIVLLLRRRNFDEVDAVEKYMLDIGEEWPDGEDPGVARYRHFYQSWVSVVQGSRDIDKHTAIRLAGILTFLYHGSRKSAPFWPPLELNPRVFLPEKFKGTVGIEKDILKFHKKYGDVELKDAIEEVIQICEGVPFSTGLHFNIKVPTKSEILKLKKLESRVLCISKNGLLCFPNGGKENCFKEDFSNIRNWATSDTSFRLAFGGKNGDFHAYTYQARQIMEMMQIYVKMAYDDYQKNPKKVDVSDV